MPSGGGKGKKRETIVQAEGGEGEDECYHPSVTETPNPKAAYPRWERARMAAAAKIKNKVRVNCPLINVKQILYGFYY